MRKIRTFLASTLLSSVVAACGGGDATAPDETPEPDVTAPTVVSMTPADGTLGQRSDAVVTITFSEAMDQDSVEGSLDIDDLGDASLSWNSAGTVLTITPDSPLPYAEGIGDDPAVIEPFYFTVTLGNAGLDLAGNKMSTGEQVTFATLKSLSTTFELDHALTRSLTAEGDLQHESDDPLTVGDLESADGVRAMFTFDIDALPLEAVEIDSAVFSTRQQPGDTSGWPYGGDGEDDLGLGAAVLIDHVSYSALDNSAYNASQSAHASMGEFCIEDQVIIEHDVTDAVEHDRANRDDQGDVSQFLLRFETDNDGDANTDRVVISRDLSELQVTYLAE